MDKAVKIHGLEVLDSRGNPTVQVTITTKEGEKEYKKGVAIAPSGASTGIHEALELRDKQSKRYLGKSVKTAVENVNTKINEHFNKHFKKSDDLITQKDFDNELIKLDGSKDKSNLGANATIATSLAYARLYATTLGIPLYQYLLSQYQAQSTPESISKTNAIDEYKFPYPMMNILNGGKHADNNINIQEFMIIAMDNNFPEALRKSVEVYHSLKQILKEGGFETAVGDEGGFAPNLEDDETALKFIVMAIEKAGYTAGKDFNIALDVAASEMYDESANYSFWKTGRKFSKESLVKYYEDLVSKYPIISIEDGLEQDDFDGWKLMMEKLGNKIQIVGDDLFVTNIERLKIGIKQRLANAILIKPNQIGTLSETLESIKLARENGVKVIISHRSGETEDSFIADLAVGVNSDFIKSGAPCRTDRVCKYNRLLNIDDEITELRK